MSDRSSIEWTDATWNPVTGCDKVSKGCDNCYAMALSARWKLAGSPKYQKDGQPPTSGPGFGVTEHPHTLDIPTKWRRPRRVFVASMGDLFHKEVSLEFIEQVFEVMAATPRHQYQILTKRSRRVAALRDKLDWPPNVWMGVSIEDSRYLHRADHLRIVPAAVLFLSLEPLLGPLLHLNLRGIGWVIVGGESGINAREIRPEWVRSIRDQCDQAGVPFFFKQWGGRFPHSNGRELDGMTYDAFPEVVPAA